MSKNLYVGNLSYDTTEDTLRMLFSEHGEIESANLITDRYTGRSRGFAFVEMSTEEEAQAQGFKPSHYARARDLR